MTRFSASGGALLLAACSLVQPAPSAEPPDSTDPEPATPAARVTSPAPAAESAIDLLECDGRPAALGGRADEFGPSGAGDTPLGALETFLAEGIFPIPRSGYVELGVVGDRSVYAFERDGQVKIVIVVSPRFGEFVNARFTVEELRACEEDEFGAADFGPGRRTWVHDETGDILTDIIGPSHCEWQSARMLHVENGGPVRQYVRDPQGVFKFSRLLETYAEGVELPQDATDSGYRSPDGFELWFTATDRAAYVVTADGVERWPRAEEPIGCA